MMMYYIRYKVGGRRMRGHFVLPLEDIERHVGPFKVLSKSQVKRKGLYDETFQKEWHKLWAGKPDEWMPNED